MQPNDVGGVLSGRRGVVCCWPLTGSVRQTNSQAASSALDYQPFKEKGHAIIGARGTLLHVSQAF